MRFIASYAPTLIIHDHMFVRMYALAHRAMLRCDSCNRLFTKNRESRKRASAFGGKGRTQKMRKTPHPASLRVKLIALGRTTMKRQALAAAFAALLITSPILADDIPRPFAWVGTWAVSPQSGTERGGSGTSFSQQTLRQILFTTVGGPVARSPYRSVHSLTSALTRVVYTFPPSQREIPSEVA